MAVTEPPETPHRSGFHVPAWVVAVVAAIVVFGVAVVIAVAVNGGGGSDHRGMDGPFRGRAAEGGTGGGGGGGGHHPFIRLLILVLVLGAIVAGVWALVRHFSRRGRQPQALSVLEDRFARGEIDEAEFRQRRDALTG